MPALPPYIIEPIWEQFAVLLAPRKVDVHSLGCHRHRVPDRLVFDKLVQVLVFGCAYERIADESCESCSATTLRRRRDEWIGSGAMEKLRQMVLEAYRPDDRSGAFRGGSRLLHHQGSLWRREGGKEPGRSGKAGHQALHARGR